MAALRDLDPDRPVYVAAHLLRARVALSALSHVKLGALQCLILLAPAVSLSEVLAACASPAGQAAEVISVQGGENTVFDALLWAAFPQAGPRLSPARIGAASWLDLPLDRPEVLATLRGQGWRIAPPQVRICH